MEQDRYDILAETLELERLAEENYFRALSKNKTIKQRIEAGVLWFPVNIEKIHYSVDETMEIIGSPSSITSRSGVNRFKVGASAILWIQGEVNQEWKGIISFTNKNKIGIILNQNSRSKEHLIHHSKCGIELIFDDRPYKVMAQTLSYLKTSDKVYTQRLREGVRNQNLKQKNISTSGVLPKSSRLNESQKKAVMGALSVQNLAIIHGPPGTGKTTTLIALTHALLKKEKKILITAPSNNAVDLLARKLNEDKVDVLRLGNVTRIGDSIAHLTLGEKIHRHRDWQHIKQVRIEAEAAHREADKHKRKFGKRQRRERGIFRNEAKELKKWAKDLENRLVKEIFETTPVICSTLIGCAHRHLEGIVFDTLIIDEASQALEAESWTAMIRAKRVIMAGDHQQLPPTVKSPEALRRGLGETILGRMTGYVDETFLLNMQYRMHREILSFSNKTFYNGQLKSASFVENRGLPNDKAVVTLIDTSGCGFDEEPGPEGRSYSNIGEYRILMKHMVAHPEIQKKGLSIGVICPYAHQVTVLRSEMSGDAFWSLLDVEVNSIDGFQGQEKDVIYLTLVRSNDRGDVGFLKDKRRLNVALTRARYKLVIIGDFSTLAHESIYYQLAQHMEEHATYKSAWEYLS